jgi:type IV pilus assembly protein PilX
MKPQINALQRWQSRNQTGATLLVALMMLLIITLLGLSSMRGVSLESRITGNLRLQRTLTNAAEAGLRIGELSINQWQCTTTAGNPNKPCMRVPTTPVNGDYLPAFNAANIANINLVTTYQYNPVTGNNVEIEWYVTDLKFLDGQAQNNCALLARDCGRHYYEITACASNVRCSSDTATQRVILRTVFAVSDS